MAKSPIAILYDSVNSRFLKYIQEGTESLLGVAAKIRNVSGTAVNPATEDTLATIDGVLDSIKDTDGVKKITDPLPAGTNEIGKVSQGTKASGSDGWPTVLYDSSGNAVAVTLEDGVYRIEALSKIRNASGTVVNPATEETLENVETAISDGSQKVQLVDGAGEVLARESSGVPELFVYSESMTYELVKIRQELTHIRLILSMALEISLEEGEDA